MLTFWKIKKNSLNAEEILLFLLFTYFPCKVYISTKRLMTHRCRYITNNGYGFLMLLLMA